MFENFNYNRKSNNCVSYLHIIIIFNVIEKNGVDPAPIDQADDGNE